MYDNAVHVTGDQSTSHIAVSGPQLPMSLDRGRLFFAVVAKEPFRHIARMAMNGHSKIGIAFEHRPALTGGVGKNRCVNILPQYLSTWHKMADPASPGSGESEGLKSG